MNDRLEPRTVRYGGAHVLNNNLLIGWGVSFS